MEDKIPIPTDNIYKFYALFGLVLFIFCAGSFIFVQEKTNDLLVQANIELAGVKDAIKASPTPTEEESTKEKFLLRRIEISSDDRSFLQKILGSVVGIAVISTCFGFWQWHYKVQPVLDEMAQLQLSKLRMEVEDMKAKAGSQKSSGETETEIES